jgi:hypothetical protein
MPALPSICCCKLFNGQISFILHSRVKVERASAGGATMLMSATAFRQGHRFRCPHHGIGGRAERGRETAELHDRLHHETIAGGGWAVCLPLVLDWAATAPLPPWCWRRCRFPPRLSR